MTERQREHNLRGMAARRARIEREIARFIKTATQVPPSASATAACEAAEYANAAFPGLTLRVETLKPEHLPRYRSDQERQEHLRPRHRWFWNRCGRSGLALWIDTPAEAREVIAQLRDGDETAVLCSYLENDGGQACAYHNDSELLQELTFNELKKLIASKQRWLALCERERKLLRRRGHLIDVIWPLRREIRALGRTLGHYTEWVKRNGLRIKAKPIAVSVAA